MINDDDRTFKFADLVEIVVLVAVIFGLLWLLNPLTPWLKYPGVLLGTFVVLMGWRGVRKLLELRANGRATDGSSAVAQSDGAELHD